MDNFEVFSTSQPWFKGNLHAHSTVSDGRLPPHELAKIYQNKGYHFLAFTDHETFSSWQELTQDGFQVFPGIEIGSDDSGSGPYRCHHIVGIGGNAAGLHLGRFDNNNLHGLQGAQIICDQLRAQDYFTVYCHPVWSRQESGDIAELSNYHAIEIYNNACFLESNTGNGTFHWDTLLRQGKRIWGVAVDDSHQILEDYGGGWVIVNAPSLTISSITYALKNGRFYASNGPIIEAYGIRDGQVYVRCSPAQAIHFVAFERRGLSHHRTGQTLLTEAVYSLRGTETYVRIEVVDEQGKTAWSNPIFF